MNNELIHYLSKAKAGAAFVMRSKSITLLRLQIVVSAPLIFIVYINLFWHLSGPMIIVKVLAEFPPLLYLLFLF